uniref:Uncharacterized protein n=1 Tax=Fagus sylvatica TaxID=28930 RepID=A0A2N9IYX5_FAGSY
MIELIENPSRIEIAKKQVDVGLVRRVLSTNIYVDQRGEPQSAPLLLSYEPHIRLFLEGPTIPRAREVRVEPTVPFVATPATTINLSNHSDLIPTGQVSEMAPPINPFKLMGKTAGGSPSGAGRGKGKSKPKGTGAIKKGRKPAVEVIEPELPLPSSDDQEPPSPLPVVHELDDSDHDEGLVFKQKRARAETSSMPAKGTSSDFVAWAPKLLFGPGPISIRDTVLDNSKTKLSAKVAYGLARAACLPEDMKFWDTMHSGQAFRHITRGLIMTTQGVLSMEARVFNMTEELQTNDAKHEKSMAEVLESTTSNYKALEEEHFRNLNTMKEAEERVKTEAAKRAQMEGEMAEMREKVRKLESECIQAIGLAREEGKGRREGIGQGRGYGRSQGPVPIDSEDKVDEEDDEDEETEEEQGEPEKPQESLQPELTDKAADAPGQTPSS